MSVKAPETGEFESTISLQAFLLFLMAITLGTFTAAVLLPTWMPNLAFSLLGSDPKAFWYLSRGSSFVALSLLSISMALGLGMSNKLARTWPGAPAAFAIHEYVSLLGIAFSIFHALILLGDHYIQFDLIQIVIPFAANGYKPLLVGYGQLGLYIWLIVALSFYARPHISPKAWRIMHYVSFGVYLMGLYHGLSVGSDTSESWAQIYYWVSGSSLLFLLMYRIVISLAAQFSQPAPRPAPMAATRPGTTASANETTG